MFVLFTKIVLVLAPNSIQRIYILDLFSRFIFNIFIIYPCVLCSFVLLYSGNNNNILHEIAGYYINIYRNMKTKNFALPTNKTIKNCPIFSRVNFYIVEISTTAHIWFYSNLYSHFKLLFLVLPVYLFF
jgi:hypothetical protein